MNEEPLSEPCRFAGKVVFITGAGRGQGRSHAIRLAREGAALALVDVASGWVEHPPFRVATESDLAETARLVEEAGGQPLPLRCDVRSEADLDAAVRAAVDAFGGIDHVVVNAGVEG